MCSGRVDVEFVLRAFSNDVDGVFIGGCRLGECNYITHGNYHALNMALLAKRIMQHVGLNPDRLRVEFMSAGEGILFSEVVGQFSKEVKQLGPLGSSEGLDLAQLKERLDDIRKLVPYIKIAKREKLARRPGKADEYDALYTPEEVDQLFERVVSYYIDPAKCQACMTCLRRCPVEAIEGGKGQIHVIDQDKCVRCGTCLEVCPTRFAAVSQLSGEPVPPPLPLEARTLVHKAK